MYTLQLVPLVLTLTCVVGEYVCFYNATTSTKTFSGCQGEELLQYSSDDGDTQVVVCKPLVDVALALATNDGWSSEMCAPVSAENVTCPLLYNSEKWDANDLLSILSIKNAKDCETACGKTPCDRLLEVVNRTKEHLSNSKKKPVSQPGEAAGRGVATSSQMNMTTKEKSLKTTGTSTGKKIIKATTPTTMGKTPTTPTTEGTTPTTPTTEGNPTTPTTEGNPTTEGTTPTTPTTEGNPTTPTTEGKTPTTPTTGGKKDQESAIDEEGGVIDDFNSEDEYDSGDVLLSGQEDDDAVTATNNQKEENEKAGQASGHSVETDLDATREEYQGHGSGFFFSLFLVMAILCVGGYLFWHNRKKAHDFFTDRRRGRRAKDYRPLLA